MLVTGELTMDRAMAATGGEKAWLVYSDPPWGQGNLRYWRTYAGDRTVPDWTAFVATLMSVVSAVRAPGGHVFLETGTRWEEEITDAMAAHGMHVTQRWTCMYGSPKRPNVLLHSGAPVDVDPTGMSGVAMTSLVVGAVARRGALAFDPCCGKGMTARAAVRHGMRFSGVELNPKRMAVTEKWLAAHGAA